MAAELEVVEQRMIHPRLPGEGSKLAHIHEKRGGAAAEGEETGGEAHRTRATEPPRGGRIARERVGHQQVVYVFTGMNRGNRALAEPPRLGLLSDDVAALLFHGSAGRDALGSFLKLLL